MKKHLLTVGAIALALCAVFYGDNVIGKNLLNAVYAATSNNTITDTMDAVIANDRLSVTQKVNAIVNTAGGIQELSNRMMQDSTMVEKIATLEAQSGGTADVQVSSEAAAVVDSSEVKVVGAALNGAAAMKVDVAAEEPQATYYNNTNLDSSITTFSDPICLDIKLTNASGEEIHMNYGTPNMVPVTITIPVPAGVDGSKAVIFHYYNNRGGQLIADVIKPIYADGKLTFSVSHFSVFGIAEAEGLNNGSDTTTEDTPSTDNDTDTPCADNNTGSSSASVQDASVFENVEAQVANAADGAVVKITKDMNVNALPNSIMQELYKKQTVSLVMEYTYGGVAYTITIPAGKAVNADIAWYGPLYLSAYYGSAKLPVAASGDGQYYTIQSGDTLSKIAAKNGTTLKAIVDMNAGVAAQKYIYPGQQVRVK